MLISLNIEVNFVNIFYLFRISLISFALMLINISINCNIKINSTEFFQSLYVNDFMFDDNVNLFCNADSNLNSTSKSFHN